MKNIHIIPIPTKKPSRIISSGKEFTLLKNITTDKRCKNIYITNDEEIKKGDWVTNGEYISQAINEWWTKFYIGNPELKADYWKIILTTDQDLIKDGVQTIDDEFLEWFVKNPSCEFVKYNNNYNRGNGKTYYKIIIPKEEPKYVFDKKFSKKELEEFEKRQTEMIKYEEEELKQDYFKLLDECIRDTIKQETLEEAAERINYFVLNGRTPFNNGFKEGAKWQQQNSCSEEEVMDMFRNLSMHLPLHYEFLIKEQFKKK